MNIGLIDVDGHSKFPNLALMKISTFYKNQGSNVEFVNLFNKYDRVYQSKIFSFSPDYEYIPQTKMFYKGGTGYNLENKFNKKIESCCPDYSLYGIKNVAYGFLTRGCPRNCSFCIVGKKEGLISKKVADLDEFWNGQKEIKLLDPNLLACKDSIELLSQLVESKAYIDFTQGLDARLLTEEKTDLIKQIKIKMLHFAWDNIKDSEIIIRKLEGFKKATDINFRKARVYVLVNFNTTIEEDLYRIYKIKELGYDPYVMIFEKWNASKKIKEMARWVNNKFIFRVCEKFEDYNLKGEE